MTIHTTTSAQALAPPANHGKFQDPNHTLDGSPRAQVALDGVKTLWFNTGTLCNIACVNCYIESTPLNDRLAYLSHQEVADVLRAAFERGWPIEEISFTGGEPFMNPDIIEILEESLATGRRVLVLTNAMRPMTRPRVQAGLLRLRARWGDALTLRISIDHHTRDRHDSERGAGAFDKMLEGVAWLRDNGFRIDAAGRSCWGETEVQARAGYQQLFDEIDLPLDALDPARCVLFPEMDLSVEVPEITTACWDILGKSPSDVMCASSRMVIKRKGAAAPTVAACTLLPYDLAFDTGPDLAAAEAPVALNHPHCAKFCVLGGASCSG